MDLFDNTEKLLPFQANLPAMLPALPANLAPLVAAWLQLDVANGDARADTLATYLCHFNQWLEWCRTIHKVEPAQVTQEDVKAYRQFLIGAGAARQTIALKLTTIRRFYQAAVDRKLLEQNPAAAVRPPRERDPEDHLLFLSAVEAELLVRALPKEETLIALRDRAIIAMMLLEGLRRVEIHRANVTDFHSLLDGSLRFLVRGKGRNAYIYPREDTLAAVDRYLELRGDMAKDAQGEPLFVSVTKGGKPRARLSRIGVSWLIDRYLEKTGLKKENLGCHGLRHTCGFLLYQETKDVRLVQETLRHTNISTAAKYSHVANRAEKRPTRSIPIKI